MPSIFLQLAHKVIQEEKRPLTAAEIWQIAQDKGYDRELPSKGKTPGATLGAMLYVEIRDNAQSDFVVEGARPKKFMLRSLIDGRSSFPSELQITQQPFPQRAEYLEKQLHPFLVYFGFNHLKVHLKTIRHNKSEKRGFGEWVHPDIVGCYFPFSDWKDEVVEVSSLLGNTAVKLYSFELKRELSMGNLREAFFQAVSNSSWANESYLAAGAIDHDEDFRNELARLSASFGVGVISIDTNDPDSSAVLLPARSKELVDWESVNKLASINPDFLWFLKRVKLDISSREIRKELYDRVLEKEVLIQSLTSTL